MDRLLHSFLRFDERSLGLFRWLIGITLITDLLHRWDWLRAFYSNEGVLPNHNHLFLMKDEGEVWSFYHSFSSVDEAGFAFLVTLFIYVGFTVGWHTRVFHALSLVCLVALAGRNVLLDAVGNSVAIGLVATTLFLPLGRAFSVDSLSRSFSDFDEKTPADLNDRSRPVSPKAPSTLVPIAFFAFLALVYYGAALQQTGETWKDGSALYYALHVDRWTGASGVWLRETLPAGALATWTRAMRIAELAIVPIALVPVARKIARPIAIALMLFHGLTIGIFFTYGLYGWSLVAAAALLVPEESWESLRARHPIRLFYDDDCGFCLWCVRLLKRLDLRRNIVFFANSGELPDGVSREMVEESIVVVDPRKKVHREAGALSEILRALPLLGWLGWLVRIPGPRHLVAAGYRAIARRRLDISVALGLDACGVPTPVATSEPEDDASSSTKARSDLSPAAKTWAVLRRVLASAGAAAFLLAVAAQSVQAGDIGTSLGLAEQKALASASRWLRVTAPWGLWSPDPPRENAALVVSAETRSGWQVDPLTGYPPDLTLSEPARHRKGVLWDAYQRHIQDDAYEGFRAELRRYLVRGGFAVDVRRPEMSIQNLEVFWVSRPIPPPGAPGEPGAEPARREIFMKQSPDEARPRPRIDRTRFPGLRQLR